MNGKPHQVAMDAPSAPVCFATAATESFVPGAVVTIGSFRRHHPDFDGDVVVIHDGLAQEQQESMQAACGDIRFEEASAELRQRLDALGRAEPHLAPHLAEFLSLEAFRLGGYRKVLFYDSDVLFQASVAELFRSPALLLGRSDEAWLRGKCRDPATFAQVPCGVGALQRAFGAGFLMIDGKLLADGRHYESLLAQVSPEGLRDRATNHTDQFILNRHFAGRQTLVDWRYDYVLPMAEEILARTGWRLKDAKALHFAGPVKPWMPLAMLRWTEGRAPIFKPRQAYRQWTDAYMEFLTKAHSDAAKRRHGEATAHSSPTSEWVRSRKLLWRRRLVLWYRRLKA